MQQDAIIQGSIAIAEFLGWEKTAYGDEDYYTHNEYHGGNCLWQYSAYRPQHMKFHNDYNWLMVVVDKLEEEGFSVVIKFGSCIIDPNRDNVKKIAKFSPNRALNIFLASIDAIQWYNTTKQQ